jgi:hypothetical protein
MNPIALLGLQFTFSVVLSALVAAWYVWPAVKALPTSTALVPLFLVHALRYLPSSAFAPGQVGADIPMEAMRGIAYGDLGSAVLAVIAAVLLHYRWSGAIAVAWAVNIVTSLDWLYAGFLAASSKLATHAMGGNWYIINYYVPIIGVLHVVIFARLLTADPPGSAA